LVICCTTSSKIVILIGCGCGVASRTTWCKDKSNEKQLDLIFFFFETDRDCQGFCLLTQKHSALLNHLNRPDGQKFQFIMNDNEHNVKLSLNTVHSSNFGSACFPSRLKQKIWLGHLRTMTKMVECNLIFGSNAIDLHTTNRSWFESQCNACIVNAVTGQLKSQHVSSHHTVLHCLLAQTVFTHTHNCQVCPWLVPRWGTGEAVETFQQKCAEVQLVAHS